MNDARFKRMAKEYEALRSIQNSILDGLEEMLPAKASSIEAYRKGIQENREAILVNTRMLQAKIEHLEAPCEEKPPMGFHPDLAVTI